MNYIEGYDKDIYKMLVPYSQPMLYMFGKRDPLKNLIEKAIVEEGDFTLIHHSSGHNIP